MLNQSNYYYYIKQYKTYGQTNYIRNINITIDMINIIQHLWQYEIQHFVILPTCIKINNEKPKTYFYSYKNGRVMRKKTHDIDTAIENLGLKDKSVRQWLLFMVEAGKSLAQVQLVLSNQVVDYLITEDSRVCCSAIMIQGDIKIEHIIKLNFDISLNFQIEILMSIDKKSIWGKYNYEIDKSMMTQLQEYGIKFWQEITNGLKCKSKCVKLQLIVGTYKGKIYLIWCNRLLYKQYQFYQIDYQMVAKEGPMVRKKIEKVGQSNKKQKIMIIADNYVDIQSKDLPKISERNEVNAVKAQRETQRCVQKEVQKGETKQCSNEQICKGCQQIIGDFNKQLDNEQIIRLRRQNKLSIKGLLQDYYLVCQRCYELSDQ